MTLDMKLKKLKNLHLLKQHNNAIAKVFCLLIALLTTQAAAAGLPAIHTAAGEVFWPLWVGGQRSAAPNANGIRYGLGPRAVDGYDFHGGVDIPAPDGTPVFAVADGKVTAVNTGSASAGNQIVLDHGSGRFTVYNHLSNSGFPAVQVGAAVVAGVTNIGKVGDTGSSPGNFHLHLTYLVAPAGSGFTGTQSNEVFARSPLQLLPHKSTSAADIDVKVVGSAVKITLPVTATVTRFVVGGSGGTRELNYYDVLKQGSSERDNTVQNGLRIGVTSPTSGGYPGTGGNITLTLDTDGGAPFVPDQLTLFDYAGNIVYQKKSAPGAPTGVVATPGDKQATVAFLPPASNGGSAITSYTVTCNNGVPSASGFGSPITIASLSNSTTYQCSVTATNAIGTSPASAMVSVTPSASGSGPGSGSVPAIQGVWWAGGAENGWGLGFIQNGNTFVAGWYYYGTNGQPTWTTMPPCTWNAIFNSCSGTLYNSSGSWLGNYTAANLVQAPVGTVTFTFTDANNGTMQYVVNGVPGQKAIKRLYFGWDAALGNINYTDLWWGGIAENGWGLTLFHEQVALAGAWYTYNGQGQAIWYLVHGSFTSPNTFSGGLVRATGSPMIGAIYTPAAYAPVDAGTITITFSDANNGSMTYTVDGVTQTKNISRFPF